MSHFDTLLGKFLSGNGGSTTGGLEKIADYNLGSISVSSSEADKTIGSYTIPYTEGRELYLVHIKSDKDVGFIESFSLIEGWKDGSNHGSGYDRVVTLIMSGSQNISMVRDAYGVYVYTTSFLSPYETISFTVKATYSPYITGEFTCNCTMEIYKVKL